MSTLLLFGAGASHGSEDCTPYCPPLGNTLFAELQSRGFLAAASDAPLVKVFRKDGFEEGMLRLMTERPLAVTALLRELALYFVQFDPGPENLYTKVVRWAIDSLADTTFATLNYDTLLEQAISGAGYRIAYAAHPVPAKNLAVLKIHGSCHFLLDERFGRFEDVGFSVQPQAPAVLDMPCWPARNRQEVRDWCTRNDSVAPAIACYMRGKPIPFGQKCVRPQVAAFQREVGRAQKIFIVGVRVAPEDDHIWGSDALATARAPISYVGFPSDEADLMAWSQGHGRPKDRVIAQTFREALPILKAGIRR